MASPAVRSAQCVLAVARDLLGENGEYWIAGYFDKHPWCGRVRRCALGAIYEAAGCEDVNPAVNLLARSLPGGAPDSDAGVAISVVNDRDEGDGGGWLAIKAGFEAALAEHGLDKCDGGHG